SLERREAAVQAQEGNRQQQDSDLDTQRGQLDEREAALHVQEAELADLQQKLDSRDKALTATEQDPPAPHQACPLPEKQLADSKLQLEQQAEELAVREVAAEMAQTRLDAEVSTQSDLQTSWEEERQRMSGDVAAVQAERDELRQKFELALADL